MESISHSKKRVNVFSFLLILILAVALAIAIMAYVTEQSRVADLRKHNESLQSKVETLQGMVNKEVESTNEPDATDSQSTTVKSKKGVTVTLYDVKSNQLAISPLGVVGKLPGSWSSEASFPVILKDANGKELAKATAKVQGDWMTEKDVPFAVTLTFDKPTTATGTLELQKDNPSGLAENEDSVSIPVKFE